MQMSYGLSCHLARVTLVAQESADYRAILLLNPSLIILPGRSGTGELDAPVGAVPGEGIADEHAVVVGVDAEDGEGQLSRRLLPVLPPPRIASLASKGTASVQPVQTSVATRLWMKDPPMLSPQWATKSISRKPGGGQSQSAKVRTGMCRPRCRLRRRLRRLVTVVRIVLQQPVQRSRAGGQQPLSHLRVQVQVTVSFHGLNQMGQRRLQPLPADPVRSFPKPL